MNNLVAIREEYEKTQVEQILTNLEKELVGLISVKKRIREITALLMIDKLRKNLGLSSVNPSLHMSFTGNPGTGKTTVALNIAKILYKLGYIKKSKILTVTRDDLVGQYIGHTAPKTKEVLKKAMGGVLFIDEAYYLYKPDNERDYGGEAIEILLQVMENQRTELVVILAGYKDKMDIFYKSNPGLSSRISNHIEFPDYSVPELIKIARIMLSELQYEITQDGEKVLAQDIEKEILLPSFANARTIKNIIERARMQQAKRLFKMKSTTELNKRDLIRLESIDILQ